MTTTQNHKKTDENIHICWLRRDLRLEDNAAFYHALKSGSKVLVFFLFDQHILEKLADKADARVTFIYETLAKIKSELEQLGSSLLVKVGLPEEIWPSLLKTYHIQSVFTNHDYEPYATQRDQNLAAFFKKEGVNFFTFKDQVIFEKDEITKADGKPYTVFTPYYKQWHQKLNPFFIKSYPTHRYFKNLWQDDVLPFPSLADVGFERSTQKFPSPNFEKKIGKYDEKRDFPSADATTRLGLHLRFGTVSIRKVVSEAIKQGANKWLSELAWREFYMMILWHFPQTATQAFKPAYDQIEWRNNEAEFEAWRNGETGYAMVDAGMKQLNETGFMHNRVRMVVASFLCKHLLIDWRWGEAYFAEKLLDYEQASNVGGWQWACGSGNDAAPYFRVFNPTLQLEKFDPKMEYVLKWAPAYRSALAPIPIVEHTFARDRALKAFKKALK